MADRVTGPDEYLLCAGAAAKAQGAVGCLPVVRKTHHCLQLTLRQIGASTRHKRVYGRRYGRGVCREWLNQIHSIRSVVAAVRVVPVVRHAVGDVNPRQSCLNVGKYAGKSGLDSSDVAVHAARRVRQEQDLHIAPALARDLDDAVQREAGHLIEIKVLNDAGWRHAPRNCCQCGAGQQQRRRQNCD